MLHYTNAAMFSLFHYLFVTLLLCSMLPLSIPLFLTSLNYLFKVFNVSLSYCYVTAFFLGFTGPFLLKSTTSQRRSQYSTGLPKFDAEAQQVTASEGLAQGPYGCS